MKYTIKVHKKGRVTEKKVDAGTNLLKFFREESLDVHAPCSGKGTCGKCKVRVSGLDREPSQKEKKMLGEKTIEKGYRLACYNKVNSDLEIYLDRSESKAKIAVEGSGSQIKTEPLIEKHFFQLPSPDIKDQRSDEERIEGAFKKEKIKTSLEVLRDIPAIMSQSSYKVTLVHMDRKLISVETGDTRDNLYGIAVDIGTTTIAGYLYNMNTGKRLDTFAALNPQKIYGADVISRISYSIENNAGLEELQSALVNCINDMVDYFTRHNNISGNDIYTAVFVGNTTMMHFLMKIPAAGIAVAPFIPVTTRQHKFEAAQLGLSINPRGCVIIFPSVSAYIGADTIAAVLSSGMYSSGKTSLLIDIGTNGEIVLGSSKGMYACSTAAGPAFEAANIRNGMGGVSGAIDKVSLSPKFTFTTIDNERAEGICGSGLVDVIAGMLTVGMIDESGRITEAEDMNLSKDLKQRLVEIEGMKAFVLTSSEGEAGTEIAITQKDVRELQNAKAAIAAGIKTLAKQAGISLKDIEKVYLAGGFGSYISIESALKIGLLPKEFKGKIEAVGNAAGSGAVQGLLSHHALHRAEKIKEKINYIELSACKEFMDEYVECMMFE